MHGSEWKGQSVPDDRYTHGHHESVVAAYRDRTAENSAGYLLPRLSRGDRILDIGCGPGTITADLATLVSPGEVTAIDREPSMVEETRRVARERGIANLTVDVGDIYALEFPDDTFDIVHAHQVFHHLSDPVAALRQMHRVARTGGLVAVREADYSAMTWYPADQRLDLWQDIYHAAASSNGAELDAGRRLLAWAHEAGLSEVVASASVWCFADDESREWLAHQWAHRMTESAIADQAISEGIATQEELNQVAQGFLAWGDHPDSWFTVLHGEILATA